jgi:hypothetical protein
VQSNKQLVNNWLTSKATYTRAAMLQIPI